MRRPKRQKCPLVIYDISAKCLDLDEFSGIFSGRKRKKLYESVMKGISAAVLDLFDIETFSFGHHENCFHILIWARRDEARMAKAMHYIRERFAGEVNRSLGRTGPVWDGQWSYDVNRLPAV